MVALPVETGWPCGEEGFQARLRYVPHNPTNKQRLFCMLDSSEAFFGGAGGGGKTEALLMAALQFADVPGYSAILFRRTYADLSLPGSLMDMAAEWLGGSDARWESQAHTWHFPSGATLTFGYLDAPNDHYRYKSAEFQYIGFDEVSEIRESQYRFLFSRRRKSDNDQGAAADGVTLADVPLRTRSASNPGGLFPEWVYNRFVNPASKEAEAVFVPAKIADNPYLDSEGYVESLQHADPITRAQILEGIWNLQIEGAMFQRDKLTIVHEPFAQARRVRYWDLAGTAQTEASPDPDRSVGVRLALAPDGLWRIEHIEWFAREPAETEKRVRSTADSDGVEIPIVIEAVASHKVIFDHYARNVLRGYQTQPDPARGSKGVRAAPVASAWNNGLVSMVSGVHTRAAIDEICTFTGEEIRGRHDDVVDALSGAHRHLAQTSKAKVLRAKGPLT